MIGSFLPSFLSPLIQNWSNLISIKFKYNTLHFLAILSLIICCELIGSYASIVNQYLWVTHCHTPEMTMNGKINAVKIIDEYSKNVVACDMWCLVASWWPSGWYPGAGKFSWWLSSWSPNGQSYQRWYDRVSSSKFQNTASKNRNLHKSYSGIAHFL